MKLRVGSIECFAYNGGYLGLRLRVEGVVGRLRRQRHPAGFSCTLWRYGTKQAVKINKVCVQEQTVRIYLDAPATWLCEVCAAYTPPVKGAISDAAGNQLAAMQEQRVRGNGAVSAFVTVFRISESVLYNGRVEEIPYPDESKINHLVRMPNLYLDFSWYVQAENSRQQRLLYLMVPYECEEDCTLALHFGFNFGIRVWNNGEALFASKKRPPWSSPCNATVHFSAKRGKNRLVIGVKSNGIAHMVCCLEQELDRAPKDPRALLAAEMPMLLLDMEDTL